MFSVKMDESASHIYLDGVFGYEKTIKIPSAMWPLQGRGLHLFFPDNTEPCTDTDILDIFDRADLRVGRCYNNAAVLMQAFGAAGIPAQSFAGWLLFGDTIPVHHCIVVVHENQVLDASVVDTDAMYRDISSTGISEENMSGIREKMAKWVKEQSSRPRRETATCGKVRPGYVYVMGESSPQKAMNLRQKLERAYPKHPAWLGQAGGGTYTALQEKMRTLGLE